MCLSKQRFVSVYGQTHEKSHKENARHPKYMFNMHKKAVSCSEGQKILFESNFNDHILRNNHPPYHRSDSKQTATDTE